ncbi:hypothetical protein BDV98DRAFT_533388 [Pterulicium gracile]|uniref:ORC1/DEAH AAA+ ATPase domain-containing protein n=1 Tax=Pterulicium gracile TaxID=1884261 RepID=A0A5C3QAF9_9AGAR|nr:hypothetical protein BDV98DRAFT_533388 [Pterula gracilis]
MPRSLKSPRPHPLYTGGRYVLHDLQEHLLADHKSSRKARVLVAWGPPGCGKSQTISQFVQTLQEDSSRPSHVFWIDASNQDSVRSALQDIAKLLALENGSAEGAVRWMTTCEESWLLIFDNHIDQSLDLRPYFPSSNQGRIIITSRHPIDCESYVTTDLHVDMRKHYVGGLPENEAVELLVKITGLGEAERDSAISIVKELGYHAHSITVAGNWMQRAELPVEELLENLLSTSFMDIHLDLRDVLANRYGYAFNNLTEQTKCTLQLCSFLHHAGITSQMFCTAASQVITFKPTVPLSQKQKDCHQALCKLLRPPLHCEARNPLEHFNAIVGELHSVLLIAQGARTISLPPVMNSWARSQCSESAQPMAELFLFLSFPMAEARNLHGFLSRLHYTPHIISVLQYRPSGAASFADCNAFFARVCFEGGLWKDAELLQHATLLARKAALGDGHPATMAAVAEYARTTWERGDRVKGLTLMKTTTEKYRELYEREKGVTTILGQSTWREEMIFAMSSLAKFYVEQDRWQDAVALYNVVFSRSQDIFGPDHPDTIATQLFCAFANSHEDGTMRSESLIDISSKLSASLGSKHPLSLWSSACRIIARPQLTEDDYAPIRSSWEHLHSVAGATHPYTLDLLYLFATALHIAGPPQEAEATIESLLERTRASRGSQHPKTMQAMQLQSDYYSTWGRVEEASKLLEQLKELRTNTLGAFHSDTLYTSQSLAMAAFSQSRFVKAEAMASDVLGSFRLHFRTHTHRIVRALQLYSRICQYEEKWPKVEELQEEILARLHESGIDEKDNRSIVERSIWLWAQSCQGKHLTLETERLHGTLMETALLRLQTQRVDADNASAVDALHYLALGLQARFLFSEAVQLHGQVLTKYIQTRLSYHPTTLAAASHLARCWTCSGDIRRAEELITMVGDARRRYKTLGEEHPDALVAKRHYALLISAKGKWVEARRLLVEVLDAYENLQPPNTTGSQLPLIHTLSREIAHASLRAHFFTDADEIYSRLLHESRAAYGRDHPLTAAIVHEATLSLDWKGDWQDAKRKRTWVFAIRADHFGRYHPYTLTSELMLSRTLVNLGRYRQAEQLQWTVLYQRSQLYQDSHPDTLEAKLCLGINFIRQHRFEEAERMLLNVVSQRQRHFGGHHPLTMESKYYLGIVYGQTNPSKGIITLESVVRDQKLVLGEDEPASWSSVSALVGSMLTLPDLLESAQSLLTYVARKHRGRSVTDVSHWTLRNKHTQIMLCGLVNRLEDSLKTVHALGESLKGQFGENHPWTIATLDLEANLCKLERRQKSSAPIREQLRKLRQHLANDTPSSWSRIDSVCRRGASLLAQKLLVFLQ